MDIEHHKDHLVIPISGQKGAVYYLLYQSDPAETWDSIGALMGVQRPWRAARAYAKRADLPWPPRHPKEGRPGRPWKTKKAAS